MFHMCFNIILIHYLDSYTFIKVVVTINQARLKRLQPGVLAKGGDPEWSGTLTERSEEKREKHKQTEHWRGLEEHDSRSFTIIVIGLCSTHLLLE